MFKDLTSGAKAEWHRGAEKNPRWRIFRGFKPNLSERTLSTTLTQTTHEGGFNVLSYGQS
jgi:hypothetical protein